MAEGRRQDMARRTRIHWIFAVVALVSIADLHHRITVYIAATQPRDAAQEQHWVPAGRQSGS